MRAHHRQAAFLLFAILVLGCGKKAGSDADPTPGPNLTPGGQPPAGPLGIEGTYLVVGGEIFGEKVADEGIAKDSELDRTVKISKDRIQLKLFKRETLRYKLDPSKSPKEIDLFPEELGEKSKGSYGIYKVEGDTLTLFVMGAEEPQLRPREFKTLEPFKERKGDKAPDKQVGGFMMMTLKKVSDDTTFISEPPPKPKTVVDEDGPIVAELTKKGFIAEKVTHTKVPGVAVTVPSTLPLEVLKALNGQPRIRILTFASKKQFAGPDPLVTDEALQSLSNLDGLTALFIESCPKITAVAFRNLSRFPKLTIVEVGEPADDAMTEEFAKVKTLERIKLSGSKLTDKSLANFATIKSLKNLWLGDAKVTASGIKHLNALTDLKVLALQRMPAADSGLGELNLPKLEMLNLAQSDITDEGLGKLPVLPKLRDLTLGGFKLTDTGLKHLLKQPSLESVTLFDTKATKAGAEELKKLKPKLFISGIN